MNRSIAFLLAYLACNGHAFSTTTTRTTTTTQLFSATGGWGIGQSRELTDAEKAKGERRAFDGYKMQDRGDFMRQVKQDRAKMFSDEKDELLAVAKMAGIDVKPSNKFDDDLFGEDDDDLDLSVTWDEVADGPTSDSSITRLDEDTTSPGLF
mmetsp:Transcript_11315/g.13672  ORF Transcript_11315/g.13672 Transcript_11315/m.13672 type:complete len:152 (+) Transcript_11315:86-541(+)|eukprot:CAMPEP_0195260466 /NCGR_PEP_ID=MMETSP0706-20130129/8589_1 /TAXON_ID=33640 /ORGANISM="Asterionellopsis glacialis, Strain CCMP134" /LENGTH=151 /DNA_ID=CAMNT_0040314187 /DNA_START=86 /DNA_END=541 /DNA_ORIENTATION=-